MVNSRDKETERSAHVVTLLGSLLFLHKLAWSIENWKRDNKGRSDAKRKNGNSFVIFGWFCHISLLHNCLSRNYDHKTSFTQWIIQAQCRKIKQKIQTCFWGIVVVVDKVWRKYLNIFLTIELGIVCGQQQSRLVSIASCKFLNRVRPNGKNSSRPLGFALKLCGQIFICIWDWVTV